MPFDSGEMMYLLFSRDQSRDAVRPRMQPMPTHGQVMQVGLIEAGNPELCDQLFQRLAMQLVQDHVAAFGMFPHLVHGCGIDRAPAVDQRGPVGLDAAPLATIW